jgi:hypothetical protein
VSNSTITTTGDGDRVLTIPIRPATSKTVLRDRLYASTTVSTTSHPYDTHELSVQIDADGDIGLHFQHIYISMSDGDWDRVVNAVAEARAVAAGRDAETLKQPETDSPGIIAAREQRKAGINR